METYSSGEELIIKIRKPYTITRQRERWTEQEHNRFLEALKLYGRAWQRIEEHIGTKTAVQIRSHAQKFFTKLQKEALVKGIPIGQALDIEIPPPRPKRKPSNPYPRKMSIDTHTSQVGSKDGKSGNPTTSLPKAARVLDLEKEPLPEYQKPGDEKFGNSNETQDEDKSPTSFILVQSSPGISQSSENKSSLLTSVAPEKLCVFKEFVPILNEVDNKDETNDSYVTLEPGENKNSDKFDTKQSFEENGTCNGANLVKSHPLDEKMAQKLENECSQSENFETWPENDVRSAQSQPKRMPNISPHIPFQESMFHQIDGVHPNVFMNLSPPATSEHHGNASRFSINQPFAGFHPIFTPVQNQDNYQSFLHASSTFSNLFVSALLQNPAAHAAASSAASFWPCSTTEASADSPGGTTGGFIARQMNAAPSMAAIAAATVAAATAWWTANGLLPLCAPFHRSFNYVPASASTVPVGTDQTRADVIERREESGNPALDAQQLEPEFSEAKQHSTSKSPTLSFLDSGESNGLKSNNGLTAIETEQAAAVTELRDSNKLKGRKQVDRSSCGSNTPSSSEVETDALEKHEKDMEESREPALCHPTDASGRRSRSSSSISDSWKEVSEVGRLAFRALFSREVLPQSFSPPYDSNNKGKNNNEKDTQNADEKGDEGSQLDLNVMTWANRSSNQEVEDNAIFRSLSIKGDGLLTMGKLKSCRTGFKPYKRCSMEAKESRVVSAASQDEEKGAKRIRLEGQASVH